MTHIDITTWLTGRLVADTDLDRPALARLAAAVAQEQALWRDYVRLDTTERQYTQLYRDPNVDVWLICWTTGQDTGYHDHDRSQGAVHVCEGALFEDFFHRDEDGWIREKTNRHDGGGASTSMPRTFMASAMRTGCRPSPCTATHRRCGGWATTSRTTAASCGGSP